MSTWFFPSALVEGRIAHNVRVQSQNGVITAVTIGAEPHRHTFDGVAVPGFANTHSHIFHRGLRGAGEGEDFWSWRTEMYRLANRLDPDSYYRLARAAFAEMVAAGYTSVGEFHYVHHQPDGTPYRDHAMELALVNAAIEAGIRITVLDTCYLHAGPGASLGVDQKRFGDGSVEGWLERWRALRDALPDSPLVTVGAALHSVRAVSPDEMATAVSGLPERVPIHIHVSEQPRENTECLAAHGLTPTAVLDRAGVLSDRTTIIHATHLTGGDIAMIAASSRGSRTCRMPGCAWQLGLTRTSLPTPLPNCGCWNPLLAWSPGRAVSLVVRRCGKSVHETGLRVSVRQLSRFHARLPHPGLDPLGWPPGTPPILSSSSRHQHAWPGWTRRAGP